MREFRGMVHEERKSKVDMGGTAQFGDFIQHSILEATFFARYIGFVVEGAHDASIRCGGLLQLFTHVAVKCGLSLSGVEMFQQLGFCSPKSTFTSGLVDAMSAHETYVAETIAAPCISSIWVDNFSRYQYRRNLVADVAAMVSSMGYLRSQSTLSDAFVFIGDPDEFNILPCFTAEGIFKPENVAKVIFDCVRCCQRPILRRLL